MGRRTYVDANVLIAVCRGRSDIARRALEVLDDSGRQIVLSEAVRLEVMPKAVYHGNDLERKLFHQVRTTTSKST